MSLRSWLYGKAAEREGRALGRTGMGDFLRQNKQYIGWAFTVLSGLAATCDDSFSGLLAAMHLTCANLAWGLSVLGAFLVGAGVLPSDKAHTKFGGDAK